MSWEDDHCPVTEMLRATCAHCRPAAERARLDRLERSLREPAPGPTTREIAADRSFEDGPATVARFEGGSPCPVCDITIRRGEVILLRQGRWCHRDCL
jgi:hypothetical protein